MVITNLPDSVRNSCVNFKQPAELGNNLHELQSSDGGDMGIAAIAGLGHNGSGSRCGSNKCAVLSGVAEDRPDGAQRRRGRELMLQTEQFTDDVKIFPCGQITIPEVRRELSRESA